MRNHQNTILAMKASTLLMSVSAMVLVVLLLTSNAVAKQISAGAPPDVVIADTAPIATPPGIATVPHKPSATRLVVVRIVQVVGTPEPRQAAAIGQPALQSSNAQPAQAVQKAQPAANAAAVKGGNDQLTMPKLAAIPDVPVVQAAPAQHNNNNGGGGSKSQPAPQPQPAVTTKTS